MPHSADLLMLGAYEPFAFTVSESRSVVQTHLALPPEYTVVGSL